MRFLDTEHVMLTLYFALMEQSNLNDADVLNTVNSFVVLNVFISKPESLCWVVLMSNIET